MGKQAPVGAPSQHFRVKGRVNRDFQVSALFCSCSRRDAWESLCDWLSSSHLQVFWSVHQCSVHVFKYYNHVIISNKHK